jgi:putative flavoprotein involved in K+ transport
MTNSDLRTQHPSATAGRIERYDTIVVGGGQAGLAAGYHLARRDVDFVIVDAERRTGDVWRRRWDSLRLFTPARYSALPGMPFPAHPSHLPDKDEIADYLERYAERFDLPIRESTRALALAHDGERFVLRTDRGTLEATSVIVATGPFHTPRIPDVASSLDPSIVQLHSSRYRSPFDLPDGPELVVGAGNSGAQIALELAREHRVWLAGRNTGHAPRRVLGRDLFDWLWPLMRRASLDTRLGRRVRARVRVGGDALIGIPERSLAEAGVQRVERVDSAREGWPVAGGEAIRPRAIVWCTGFAADYSWIDLPVFDEHDVPRHTRGVVAEVPGLYFLGLRFQYRLSSSLVGGVGDDAAFVAAAVARRSAEALSD